MKEQIKEVLLVMQANIKETLKNEDLTQNEIDKLLDSLIENMKAIKEIERDN